MSMRPAQSSFAAEVQKHADQCLYQSRFRSDNLSTRHALAEIRAELEHGNYSPAFIGRVEIALAELFNNIAEHAYRASQPGNVRCTMGLCGRKMIVDVVDQGRPMPNGQLPNGTLPDVDVDVAALPEGGFGWFLIKSQADTLNHRRVGSDNVTCLSFEIDGKGQSAR